MFFLGYRAVRRHEGSEGGGLALGALFGFTTLVVHNFGDFGIHIPAIAFLATVLCAQLCALGKTPGTNGRNGARSPENELNCNRYSLHLGGVAPGIGFATVLVLGFLLGREGWRAQRVESLELDASRWNTVKGPDNRERQIADLVGAIRLQPDDAQRTSIWPRFISTCTRRQ